MAYKHTLERNQDKVIGLVLDGLSDAQVAERMSTRGVTVTRQAVTQFRRRHADKLNVVKAEVVKAVEDYAIAQKVNRIAALDALHQDIEAWLDEHSLTERSVRYDKDGNEVGETLRFRGDAVNALRAILKDAADELGQLPKPGIVVDNRRTYVLQVVGTDGHIPLG